MYFRHGVEEKEMNATSTFSGVPTVKSHFSSTRWPRFMLITMATVNDGVQGVFTAAIALHLVHEILVVPSRAQTFF